MTTIANHILELICNHDCVIVPGLGGFVANYQPAHIDEETGFFTPPNKAIGFNKNLSHNDGLLYHFITQKNQSSYSEAQQLVEDFVSEINLQIDSTKLYQLGEIGELSKDNQGNYQFTPNVNGQFLADAFGLSSFHISVPEHIKHLKQTETPIRHLISKALVNKGVAASIVLVIGLFLVTTDLKDPQKISTGSMEQVIEMIATPSTYSESIEIKADDVAVATVNTTAEQNTTSTQNISSPYHLVVASFPNQLDAEQYSMSLKNKGFDKTEVISSIPGKNRVAIEHYSNKSDALLALDEYRKKEGFESVWILKNN